MPGLTIHLRSECKPLERRSPLSPTSVKALIAAGYNVNVEKSSARIFDDEEYQAVGAQLLPEGSWVRTPEDHIITGLKELPDDGSLLRSPHVTFGHCYKNQQGWADYLGRFVKGGGTLYDIEFMTDESGRRVAAFGYWAGYAGAATALLVWSHQLLHPGVPHGPLPLYDSAPALVEDAMSGVSAALSAAHNQVPRIIIIGALGRCGTGAVDLCLAAGIPDDHILKWDMAETAHGGPFPEVVASDIFINCVYLGANPTPPFVTMESLAKPGRKLRVICDVSSDPYSPNNPIPLYSEVTTFLNPTVPVEVEGDGPELSVISIDHLPSLIPRESSEEFSRLLLPSMLALDQRNNEGVWVRAEQVYKAKAQEWQSMVDSHQEI